MSEPQVSPVSVVLMQPRDPTAPPGEPFHPLEDLTVSVDEKVRCQCVVPFLLALCVQIALPCMYAQRQNALGERDISMEA